MYYDKYDRYHLVPWISKQMPLEMESDGFDILIFKTISKEGVILEIQFQ